MPSRPRSKQDEADKGEDNGNDTSGEWWVSNLDRYMQLENLEVLTSGTGTRSYP